MDSLIGATGFVGSQLARQHAFGARFNSRNIGEAQGRAFERAVCAAAPGSMFEANRFPDLDKQRLDRLASDLSGIRADRFILISTIAVFDDFRAESEDDTAHFANASVYGRHRRELEVFCAGHFPSCLIVRLPALFGAGLKKNFLFDILNPMPSMLPRARFEEMADQLPEPLRGGLRTLYGWNETLGLFVIDREALDASGRRADYDAAVTAAGFAAELFTSPATRFQFYDMSRLWSDITRCLAAGLDVAHFAPPPLEAATVYRALTGRPMPESAARIHTEDMRTRHAAVWSAQGPYMETADAVLARLQGFFEGEKRRAA